MKYTWIPFYTFILKPNLNTSPYGSIIITSAATNASAETSERFLTLVCSYNNCTHYGFDMIWVSSKIQETQAEQLQGAACCPKKIHL